MKNNFFLSVMLLVSLFSAALNAQTQEQIEKINVILDTVPYFDIRGLDFKAEYHLPDSTKIKIMKAIKRELPVPFLEKELNYSDIVLENIRNYAWRDCGNDTACFEKMYAERYAMNIERDKANFSNRCLSQNLILACGSWSITEAIPYLEKELTQAYCIDIGGKEIIERALAKLGNDSIKNKLVKRYTLSFILTTNPSLNRNTPLKLDTINNEAWSDGDKMIDFFIEGLYTAIYLKDKKILLNLLDLIYIKGKYDTNIDIDYTVSVFLQVLDDYNYYDTYYYFHKFSNYEQIKKICSDYISAIWHLEKKSSKKEKQELQTLLSTEYRTKIKEQLRDWIIENVNFE